MSRSNYTKRTFRKETTKRQIQLVHKFPHKSILKGSPFFPARGNRGDTSQLQCLGSSCCEPRATCWVSQRFTRIVGSAFACRWVLTGVGLLEYHQTKKLNRNLMITRFADPTAYESKSPSWEDTLGPNSIPKVYSNKVPWIHWDK